MTRELFREDSYLKSCEATVTATHETGVETDQSVFYPLGGGQLGDTGWLVAANGQRLEITDTVKDSESGRHLHVIADMHSLAAGDTVSPELVRTLSVQPPRNAQGTIRLVEFEGVDLQPCGGTHVASTSEIGRVRVQTIEKKGRQNRRIIMVFDA